MHIFVADTLREVHLESNPLFQEVNVTEVLSLIIDANLTKHQYLKISDFINSKLSYKVLPSYKVLSQKKKSYPDAESVSVSESQAEVELQSLLDHTASRILDLQTEVLNVIHDVNISNLVLISKWGFDGSSGYSEYKQRVSNNTLQDKSLFVTSYVPLKLVTKSSTLQDTKVIWKNPRPSSTRYCRPIRFSIKKETTEVCIEERNYFTKKIDMLKCTEYLRSGQKINVEHKLQLTLVDGKVCNALSQTSSAKCYICQAKPKEMNDIYIETAKGLVEKYLWFYLPPLVHTILVHGSEVIESAIISIGELSEEAAEAKNKDIKRYRHMRKTKRIATNTDLLNMLLLSSDPFITGQRKLLCKKKSALLKSTIELLED